MTEKIDWYREVLEIEPNSKVFFPLARLLVKEKMPAEAIATLEKGLDRHPEFLEARLLLIELLHKNGETEACNDQIAKLSQIFASYTGFWEAWAACLASNPHDADIAAIIRVLAATFIAGPLQLHEVLDRGVSSIINERTGSNITYAQTQIASQAPSPDILQTPANDSAMTENVMHVETVAAPAEDIPGETETVQESSIPKEYGANAESDVHEKSVMPESRQLSGAQDFTLDSENPEDLPEQTEKAETAHVAAEETFAPEGQDAAETSGLPEMEISENLPESEDNMQEAASGENAAVESIDENMERTALSAQSTDNDQAAVTAEMRAASSITPIEAETEPTLNSESDLPAIEDEPESDSDAADIMEHGDQATEAENDNAPIAGHGQDTEPATDTEISATMNEPTASEEEEEPFSLRTRSMADVLAEQGDLQGALDIYAELAAAADGQEREELNAKIENLRAAHDSQTEKPFIEADDHGKENLLGILEALARRVEARVNN